MPFQFSVDEGCLGGRLQSSTWKHAASAREVFHLFLRVREACSPPSQYCQHLLKERCMPGASPPPHVLAPWGVLVLQGGCKPQTPPVLQELWGSTQCIHSAVLQLHGEEFCPPFPAPAAQPARLLLLHCFQGDKRHTATQPRWVSLDLQLCCLSRH